MVVRAFIHCLCGKTLEETAAVAEQLSSLLVDTSAMHAFLRHATFQRVCGVWKSMRLTTVADKPHVNGNEPFELVLFISPLTRCFRMELYSLVLLIILKIED